MDTPSNIAGSALREAAALAGSSWMHYHTACRALDRIDPESIPEALRARVALLGSFTLDPFLPFLRIEAARAGLWLDTYLAPYGQYLQELLDSGSGLYAFRPHVTFIAIDSDVLWNQRWAENPPLKSEPVASTLLTPLFDGLNVFDGLGTGIVVINDFVLPRRSTEGVHAFRIKSTFSHTVAHANKHLRLRLASRSNTYLFPLADLVLQIGRERSFNWRTHYRGHVTWADPLMVAAAHRYTGFALATRGRATKCIVLDLDNTLWGGVLGEEGARGIALGPEWPGREFRDFQRELLELQRQGILLTICSKNNEAEALAVLRDHPQMLIREKYLAALRINWDDKATNIRSLAAELDLGLDHMLLIDDSPHERAWVRQQLPDLRVPDLPPDPAQYAEWVGSLPSLIVLQRTTEDLVRTELYQQGRTREEFRQAAGSLEDFLRGLELRVTISPADDSSMVRVVQLLAKTNQFNLTTRRHDEATLRRGVSTQGWRIFTMSVTDRFGDFGLTGLAVVVPDGKTWHLDSFLMSCRVIGKSVESALIAAVAREARREGIQILSAEYLDSGRNQVASRFLPDHGFSPTADGKLTRPIADGGPPWPDWIEDCTRGGAAPEPSLESGAA
jgi:FkbH-like protein